MSLSLSNRNRQKSSSTAYIEAWIKPTCPYSQKADRILKMLNVIYHPHYVTPAEEATAKKNNQMTTFPQIFYVKNNQRMKIGGLEDLERVLSSSSSRAKSSRTKKR